MNRLLEDLKISERVEEDPLGPYILAYGAQLLSEGYARQSRCGLSQESLSPAKTMPGNSHPTTMAIPIAERL